MTTKNATPQTEKIDRNVYETALKFLGESIALFTGKVNPDNGQPILSNVQTQIMANRPVDYGMVELNGKKFEILNFQPSRSFTGNGHNGKRAIPDHNESASWVSAWLNATSKWSDDGLMQETILNWLYLVGSVVTGKHRTPRHISYESCIKSHDAIKMAEILGIDWNNISFTFGDGEGDGIVKDVFPGNLVKGLLDFNAVKATQALEFANKGKSRKVVRSIEL